MTSQERPEIASAYIQRIRELVTGKRIMEKVDYGERDNAVVHLSDVTLGSCLAIPYYRMKALKDGLPLPEISDESCLFFLRGRAVERVVANELAPKTCEGILFTVDDFHPSCGYGEVKSTASDMSRFKPETMYDHWASRIKGYCHALDIQSFNLIVIFMVGNTPSHKWANPNRKTVALRAWSLEYTPEEIKDNWVKMRRNMAELMSCLAEDSPLDPLMVTPKDYECKGCSWAASCQYTSVKC